MKIDDLVETYVALRDRRDALKKEHEAALAPIVDGLDKLEALMLQKMNETGVDSAKTKHGTAFKKTWTSASVADWEKVLGYAIENERFDLFERRVNKTTVMEIGEVPGVNVTTGVQVNVRRA